MAKYWVLIWIRLTPIPTENLLTKKVKYDDTITMKDLENRKALQHTHTYTHIHWIFLIIILSKVDISNV